MTVYCGPEPLDGLMHPVVNIYHGVFIQFEDLEAAARTARAWFENGVHESNDEDLTHDITRRLNPRVPDLY